MSYQLSSGVYPREIDLSAGTRPTATTIGAAVFASQQGPIGPTLVTRGTEQFDALFGDANEAWSKGHYVVRAFLGESKSLWVRRVVNNALYSGTSYFNDPTSERSVSSDFNTGASNDYENYSKQFHINALSGPLITANIVGITLWDGVAAAPTTIATTFATDSNTTLAAFAAAVQVAMDAFGTGGTSTVIDEYQGPDRRQVETYTLDGETVNGDNTFSVTVTVDGTATAIGPIAFNTDNDTTLSDLATALDGVAGVSAAVRAVSGTTGSDNRTVAVTSDTAGFGVVTLSLPVQAGTTPPTPALTTEIAGAGIFDDRMVKIVPPAGMTLQVTLPSVTAGATQVTHTTSSNSRFFDVFCENPGVWGDDVGVKLGSIDKGINQRIALTTGLEFLAGGVFQTVLQDTVSNTDYPITVPFNTDSDQTLADIATAIEAILTANYTATHTGSATVTAVTSTSSNAARTVVIVAPNSEMQFAFVESVYEGTSNNGLITATETLTRVETDKSFEIQVYTRSNIATPIERFTVTPTKYVDGTGKQLFMDDVINESAAKSSYIRVKAGANAENMRLYTEDTSINWLASGSDGSLPTDSQIATAWDDFTDPEEITVRIGLACGYTGVTVHQKMDAIAQARNDMITILDVPSDKQETTNAYNFRRDEQNINSSYSTLYTPDLKVVDSNTNRILFIPPGGHVGAAFAYTDRTRKEWFAPAGLQRGVLSEVQGLRVAYKEGDRDILEPAQINSIRQMKGRGYVIWGAETLQARPTALSHINVRRLNITIAVALTDALHYFNWEPNDPHTRFAIEQLMTDFMAPIQSGRGVSEYQVVCDETNNTDTLIDQATLVVDLYYKPVLPAKFIRFNMILTKAGASFSETISAGGGNAIAG